MGTSTLKPAPAFVPSSCIAGMNIVHATRRIASPRYQIAASTLPRLQHQHQYQHQGQHRSRYSLPLHMNLNAQGSDRWNTTSSSSSSSTNKVSCGYSATTSTLATSPPLTAQANTTPVLATNYPLPIVFVLGGPGSGKGTQCDILVNTHGFEQICAGSLLRNEAARGTELGDMIKGIINRGDIVPGHITIGLLQREIDECVAKMDLQVQPALAEDYSNSVAPSPMQNVNAPKPIRGILIDGFPRALEQADEFEKAIGGDAIHLVLYFSCPIDVMRSRLRKRGETSGREDDVDEVIDKRFHTFLKTSLPVVDKYKKLGILREVEAIGSVDEIHEQVMEILKKEKI